MDQREKTYSDLSKMYYQTNMLKLHIVNQANFEDNMYLFSQISQWRQFVQKAKYYNVLKYWDTQI